MYQNPITNLFPKFRLKNLTNLRVKRVTDRWKDGYGGHKETGDLDSSGRKIYHHQASLGRNPDKMYRCRRTPYGLVVRLRMLPSKSRAARQESVGGD